ncbi:MAG: DMT family transporter, partial [Deltaproteobacteria bacterium]|nr:DMT family transporter [Deltaproteobacteria bacterium]
MQISLHTKCLFGLMATAILWSSGGLIIKNVEAPPLLAAALRAFFAGITLALMHRRDLHLRLPGKEQCLGAVALALVCLSFVLATKMTTAANAVLLQYTAPVWVAIFAPLFLHEQTRRQDWIFIAVIFFGMGLFFIDSLSSGSLPGAIIAIGGGVCYAVFVLILRHEKQADKGVSMVYGNFLLFAVGFSLCGFSLPSGHDILLLALAGIAQIGLAYYLFGLASGGVSALEMVLVTTLEPILNPIWVFLGIGEQPSFWTIA